MRVTVPRVYCAGPLFNDKERQEMAELAGALEAAGYKTFLPQRDGLELTKCVEALVGMGHDPRDAGQIMAEAIFALDVYQVLRGCDVVVANLNGRVPDEGAVSEVAMAWARGKPVVGYKADSRTAFGGQDNPLVSGLFGFKLCKSCDEVVQAVKARMRGGRSGRSHAATREEEISAEVQLGNAIWSALQKGKDIPEVVSVIMRLKGETVPAR